MTRAANDDDLTEAHQAHRAYVTAVVSARLRGLGLASLDLDVEGAYQLAWIELRNKPVVDNLPGLLIRVTLCNTIDEGRKRRGERVHDDPGSLRRRSPDEDELEDKLDAKLRRRLLRTTLHQELPTRQYLAVTLCSALGLPRADVAPLMGLDRKQIERLMDAVMPRVRTIATMISKDEWCPERESTLRAYRAELLDADGERIEWARQHLRECVACRRDFGERSAQSESRLTA